MLVRNNPEAAAQIKEIWRSPLIPADPIVWDKTLDGIDQSQSL